MNNPKTARQAGLIACLNCHLLNRAQGEDDACGRCGRPIHSRKPDSIARTWAYVFTGLMFMVPANVYPVMTVVYLGKGQPDTIMSGVIHLLEAGMYPIALLVFVASIAVPFLKLFGLIILLLVVQFNWRLNMRQCTVMYRMIEFIGRWSMLDLFMISILVTLVDLGGIATITAGVGATAFSSVVVLTILAAMSFDPRLIWDKHTGDNGSE